MIPCGRRHADGPQSALGQKPVHPWSRSGGLIKQAGQRHGQGPGRRFGDALRRVARRSAPEGPAAAGRGGAAVESGFELRAAGCHGFLAVLGHVLSLEVEAVDFLPDEPLDGRQLFHFVVRHEGEGVAGALRAAGASDAVDVVFVGHGEVIIDDVGDAGDIDAAGGDIGSDEDADFAGFEGFEGAEAMILGFIGMEGGDFEARGFEFAGDAIGAVFGSGEDEDGIVGGIGEEGDEEGEFEVAADFVDGLGDGFCGVGASTDLDGGGLVKELVGEGFDFWGEGSGEEEGLAFFGEGANDSADAGEEAHIEHAIGFIEDEEFDS